MKIALVTTPPSVRSGIGDYTRHLLPHLAELAEVQVFVEAGLEGESVEGLPTRSVARLVPREFDHILYQLGNEGHHAFMLPLVRHIGGTVVQHDWVLFDLAVRAFDAIERGGARAHAAVLREGGITQLREYVRYWFDRRLSRETPYMPADPERLEGTLLDGWHEAEAEGRWVADGALLRLPTDSCKEVRVRVTGLPGRSVAIRGPAGAEDQLERSNDRRDGELSLLFPPEAEPVIAIATSGIRVSADQRKRGDPRRLGCFVRAIEYVDREGVHTLALDAAPARAVPTVDLSSRRFDLPLNRSIVRFGDGFIVHSDWMKQRILDDRNAATPIGVVSHGAAPRWRDEGRSGVRARLGLDGDWADAFVVGSFGGVQPHKRVDKILEAVASVREARPDLRLALIGPVEKQVFDVQSMISRLSLEDIVLVTDHVDEATAWDYIHASDVMVQLRGPSTGGTSGGAFQSLSLGRAVIASAHEEQLELPGDCVVRVPHGSDEAQLLGEQLLGLAGDRQRLAALERAARSFVTERASWRLCAEQYVEHLRYFPAPRAARRSLLALRFEAARERLRAKR